MPRRPPGRRRAVALLLAAPLPAGAQPAGTARAFLGSLYRPYLQKNYEGHRLDPPSAVFTAPLAQAIVKDRQEAERRNEVPLLDGDPLVDAQDFEITDLAIDVQEAGDRAKATVTFRNSGRPIRIAVELLRTPAGWRIDDIRGGQMSLRELYKLR